MQLLLALLLVLLPPAAQPFCPAPNPARPACTPAPLRSWLKTGRVPPSSPSPPSASPPPAPSFYNITLPRSPGLSWRTDLSFRYVSVSSVDPGGPAAGTRVRAGDQLAAVAGESVVGLDFDGAMQAFGRLPRDAGRMELTLFAGSREEMLAELGGGGGEARSEYTVEVLRKGKAPLSLKAAPGANLRSLLTDNGVQVYRSVARVTNCKGKQLCGTCIVDVREGGGGTNRKSVDEESTLRTNPASYVSSRA